ncbi:MAG: hypothetical protein VYC40_00425, partial [Pseudomonadota bacterium]|nr:hypothetical protein [Pseudomonadota bacterium]
MKEIGLANENRLEFVNAKTASKLHKVLVDVLNRQIAIEDAFDSILNEDADKLTAEYKVKFKEAIGSLKEKVVRYLNIAFTKNAEQTNEKLVDVKNDLAVVFKVDSDKAAEVKASIENHLGTDRVKKITGENAPKPVTNSVEYLDANELDDAKKAAFESAMTKVYPDGANAEAKTKADTSYADAIEKIESGDKVVANRASFTSLADQYKTMQQVEITKDAIIQAAESTFLGDSENKVDDRDLKILMSRKVSDVTPESLGMYQAFVDLYFTGAERESLSFADVVKHDKLPEFIISGIIEDAGDGSSVITPELNKLLAVYSDLSKNSEDEAKMRTTAADEFKATLKGLLKEGVSDSSLENMFDEQGLSSDAFAGFKGNLTDIAKAEEAHQLYAQKCKVIDSYEKFAMVSEVRKEFAATADTRTAVSNIISSNHSLDVGKSAALFAALDEITEVKKLAEQAAAIPAEDAGLSDNSVVQSLKEWSHQQRLNNAAKVNDSEKPDVEQWAKDLAAAIDKRTAPKNSNVSDEKSRDEFFKAVRARSFYDPASQKFKDQVEALAKPGNSFDDIEGLDDAKKILADFKLEAAEKAEFDAYINAKRVSSDDAVYMKALSALKSIVSSEAAETEKNDLEKQLQDGDLKEQLGYKDRSDEDKAVLDSVIIKIRDLSITDNADLLKKRDSLVDQVTKHEKLATDVAKMSLSKRVWNYMFNQQFASSKSVQTASASVALGVASMYVPVVGAAFLLAASSTLAVDTVLRLAIRANQSRASKRWVMHRDPSENSTWSSRFMATASNQEPSTLWAFSSAIAASLLPFVAAARVYSSLVAAASNAVPTLRHMFASRTNARINNSIKVTAHTSATVRSLAAEPTPAEISEEVLKVAAEDIKSYKDGFTAQDDSKQKEEIKKISDLVKDICKDLDKKATSSTKKPVVQSIEKEKYSVLKDLLSKLDMSKIAKNDDLSKLKGKFDSFDKSAKSNVQNKKTADFVKGFKNAELAREVGLDTKLPVSPVVASPKA